MNHRRPQMAPKAHGTSARPVPSPLRWGCDAKLADRICSFNRHYAEPSGSFLGTGFLAAARKDAAAGPITFYDSVTGRPLFRAPIGRSFADFEAESKVRSPQVATLATPCRVQTCPLPLAAESRVAELPRRRGDLGRRACAAGRRGCERRRHAPRPQPPRPQGESRSLAGNGPHTLPPRPQGAAQELRAGRL